MSSMFRSTVLGLAIELGAESTWAYFPGVHVPVRIITSDGSDASNLTMHVARLFPFTQLSEIFVHLQVSGDSQMLVQ